MNMGMYVMTAVKNIVIIEDNKYIAAQMRDSLMGSDDFVVDAVFHTFGEGKAYLDVHVPDILLVDLGLPDGYGVDLIKLVEKQNQNREQKTSCVVLTMYGDEAHVMQAIEAGAAGYLLKDSQPDQAIKALRVLNEGGSPISPIIARSLLNKFSKVTPEKNEQQETVTLTKQEEAVLSQFAMGYKRTEIAKILNISVHTVNSHTKNIYRKLAVNTQTQAVFEAVQLGIIQLAK